MGTSTPTWRRGAASAILTVCLFAAASVNCFKDPVTPVPPTWDVDLTFPVGIKSVSVADLISQDSSTFQADPSNRLVFRVTAAAPPTLVGDRLTFIPDNTQSHVSLGSFSVTVRPVVTGINIPNIPPGQTVLVPSQTLAIPNVATTGSAGGTVTFASGTIGLTLTNNLPVTLTAVSPVQLLDNSGTVEAAFNFSGQTLLPGQAVTAYDDLSGKTLGGALTLAGLSFLTPGSTTPVAIPDDSMLVAALVMNDLRASGAPAMDIPPQRLSDNDHATIALNDSTLIRFLSVRSGQLQFTFTNRIGIGLLFKYRMEELLRPGAAGPAPYEDSLFLPAGTTKSQTVDLAGFRLQSASAEVLRTLRLTSSIIIPSTPTAPVMVHDTDKVMIGMIPLAPVVADSVLGTIRPTWLAVSASVPLNAGGIPPNLQGEFNIPSATLSLDAVAGAGFPADLNLQLSAVKRSGERIYLDIPAGQRRIFPGNTTITFDGGQVGSFLSQLGLPFPDSLRLSGSVLLNPPDCYSASGLEVGGVGSSTSFAGSIVLAVPMKVGIAQAAYRDTTPFGESGDGRGGKPDQEQLQRFNGGKLYLEIQNGLPAQVGVRVRLLDRMHQPLLMLPQSGQTLQVSAGAVDAQGITASPGVSTLVIELTHAEIQQFIPAEFVDYEIDLATANGGSAVTFLTTDAVRIKAWAQCSYGVNK